MKLKQRFVALVVILGVTLAGSLMLNLLTYQSRLNTENGGNIILNRELNSFDSESSKGTAEHSVLYVSRLVEAFVGLKKSPPIKKIDSGAALSSNNISYEDIAKQLLLDKSFNTDDNVNGFISLGKVLENFVKPKTSRGLSNEDPDFFKSDAEDKNPLPPPLAHVSNTLGADFPKFNLDHAKYNSMLNHVEGRRHNHLQLQTHNKKPVSFKIHKTSGVASLKSWQLWQNSINQISLYSEQDPNLNAFIKDLSTLPIVGMSTMADYGTQIKLIFKLADGSQALFKPMRIKRDHERDNNLFYFDDFERHHAEIAAFHLDRIMQFHRVPPNAGRFVNITSTIERFASKSFKKTIYTSPAGNRCFYGKCDYYCDSGHPVCGTPEMPDVVEGSMAAWLPFGKGTGKKSWENPWRRSYSKFKKADWETNSNYCDEVKDTEPYDSGRRLLDLIDITIFDYIAGNQDRHHYHTFKVFGNFTSPMLYDNGRGFGWQVSDDPSILVPLIQCCQVRYSTLRRLLNFESKPEKHLSERMRHSLLRDPLSSGPNGPVLSEGHLKALDRRVRKVLDAIYMCTTQFGYDSVILDDGF